MVGSTNGLLYQLPANYSAIDPGLPSMLRAYHRIKYWTLADNAECQSMESRGICSWEFGANMHSSRRPCSSLAQTVTYAISTDSSLRSFCYSCKTYVVDGLGVGELENVKSSRKGILEPRSQDFAPEAPAEAANRTRRSGIPYQGTLNTSV